MATNTTPTVDSLVKDFGSFSESMIDFASVTYGEQTAANRVWSDFNISSFSRNWLELVAYMGDQLMFYLDVQGNQAYLSTATLPNAITRLAQQFGYEIPTQQAASGKVNFTTIGPYSIPSQYKVLSGTTEFFTTRAVSGNTSEEVEVDAIQGKLLNQSFVAAGAQNEQFILNDIDVIVDLNNPNIELRSPRFLVNGEEYSVRTTQLDSAPNSKVVIRSVDSRGKMILTAGDGILGRKLVPNESVNVTYRIGGGSVGNLQIGEIDTLSIGLTNVSGVTNATAFSGGVDLLSLDDIKRRIPLSLQTVAGAVDLAGYADILLANFPQVAKASSAINTTQRGVDLDVFVVPQGTSITNITDNQVLKDQLTDFLNKKKTVATKFLIKNAEGLQIDIELELNLRRDASRTALQAEIQNALLALFDLNTGGADGTGTQFAQVVKVSDVFDVLKTIDGISRFEIKKFTCIPRVEAIVGSPNQSFEISEVEVYPNVGVNEWAVLTDQITSPEPANGQIAYTVHKRTLAEATTLAEDSITDSNLDLTLVTGTGIIVNNTEVTDPKNVFQIGQHNGQLLIDSSNNIWLVANTKSKSIVVSAPALNNASITVVANGAYSVVQSFLGKKVAISGLSFTIIYNSKNTFYSPAASFNLIATIGDDFFLDEEQANVGTYGVPVSIVGITPAGAVPGDLVQLDFNGNPNLSGIDNTFVFSDRTGEQFDITTIADNSQSVATYNNFSSLDSQLTLTDTGVNQSLSQEILAESSLSNAFLEAKVYLRKNSSPSGNITVELRSDNAGSPGSLIVASNPVATAILPPSGFNFIAFTFPTAVSLVANTKYHLVVQGDNAYRISYAGLAGSVDVGKDGTSPSYHAATTAANTLQINANNFTVQGTSSGTIQVVDNSIRSMQLAKGSITLLENLFAGGEHRFIINSVSLKAVAGVPGVNEFQIGGSITATRDNLKAAIDASLIGIVTTTSVSTDAIELTAADNVTYRGEAGNAITLVVLDPGAATFQLSGSTLNTGLDGDSITVKSPEYLNNSLVAYTYNSANGIVQYGGSVDLSSVLAGDLFHDASSEFTIISVDDLNNRVTLATALTISNVLDADGLSGSIYGNNRFEFGVSGLVVGATANATATNLAAAILALAGVGATALTDTVTVTSDVSGVIGNNIKLSKTDLGTSNFTLSGDNLSGGTNSDKITVGATILEASLTPGVNKFVVDALVVNTIENLRFAIDGLAAVGATTNSNIITISSATQGSAGNLIALSVSQTIANNVTAGGSTLIGGQDKFALLTYNGSVWTYASPESVAIFEVVISVDNIFVVSKSDANGLQILPQLSIQGAIDSALGKRYYSDAGEVSFLIATKTPNAYIIGADDTDLYGLGTVNGNANSRVDYFIFRTSKYEDDITNLRDKEIPVLITDNIKMTLLGGVN